MANWIGKRVLILGAARQGLALARYLVRQRALVTLNDQRSPDQLAAVRQANAALPIEWVLGEHPLRLLDQTDLVCVSGGIPLTLPIVQEAQRRGLPITNDTQIFMDAVPCPVIGITGSAGKTTTTTLVGRMAQAAIKAPRKAWIGGNIGLPLVDHLEEIKADDVVILEISSFQLEQMTTSPHIGAILNITPNHLDRHGTLEAYAAAKARLIHFQGSEDVAILNPADSGSWNLRSQVAGRLVTFSLQHPDLHQAGTFCQDEHLWVYDGQKDISIMPQSSILLRGTHNLYNVLAACAIAHAAGFPVQAMRSGVEGFGGVPHRLEFVRTWRSSKWYNDSIATAPERTSAAIHSFSEPLVVLLGGRDKKLPWDDLATLIHQRVDHVILFGEAAAKIQNAIGPLELGRRPYSMEVCGDLHEAVQAAAQVAQPGDVVLLSPGGTSYDQFKDFEERGECFREWVNQLP
ncbi:UDP-N-acetylmuramoylalanine--D-glutamate ligase [Longilinea arvoryzae]|uniref:UDP-N-acetylmuramoylalanine--D-glutamate ligase n=1 Tax=Longilinea arvoryzae TaxID=360412 RepID=A0A0S7B9Z6_9CHLR|nr:UDP-N-acetylmuramoyl-L-alanine--D-glutamate ligase [Longilinea arvoryzae]GAP14279.1 UDP-N-acetylmuramoylalanine--D-glutamate ligase [Longilinea arvoryzae]